MKPTSMRLLARMLLIPEARRDRPRPQPPSRAVYSNAGRYQRGRRFGASQSPNANIPQAVQARRPTARARARSFPYRSASYTDAPPARGSPARRDGCRSRRYRSPRCVRLRSRAAAAPSKVDDAETDMRRIAACRPTGRDRPGPVKHRRACGPRTCISLSNGLPATIPCYAAHQLGGQDFRAPVQNLRVQGSGLRFKIRRLHKAALSASAWLQADGCAVNVTW